ncbi:E3 ubiquitin-protein ligase RNF10 [Haematobia irritans]|uniref:E3 ubiquitin-protein ligase RNF10 n=1 Tax=Haematobia irritans TaxID=7368 RepID=UPI003F5012C3
MDSNKKQQQNFSRSGNAKASSSGSDSNRQKPSGELQSTKNFPKTSRRRENQQGSVRGNSNNKQPSSAKLRTYVDKRPRTRGFYCNNSGFGTPFNDNASTSSSGLVPGNAMAYAPFGEGSTGHESNINFELNSVYSSGCKKQSLNHLLNFYYTPREVDYFDGAGSSGVVHSGTYGQRYGNNKKHKYNKEQFLQANFQFVIKASATRKTDDSPDTLIDWSLIEQINIQTPDEPQCPICLYPPSAAKVTRCGHVYCWPCLLHYLSLSDKNWRKCPICYDAVHVEDLKSASIVQQRTLNVGLTITFQLMRRKKGSLMTERYDRWKNAGSSDKYPYVSSPIEDKLFSKFILARRSDIIDITSRERHELLSNVDKSCPEFVFVQQAIELLNQRLEKIGDMGGKDDGINLEVKDTNFDIKNVALSNAENVMDLEDMGLQQNAIETAAESLPKYYYFYQADDGQNVFLHPLNVKMLQAAYGSLSGAPPILEARILQKEQYSMDEDQRRKFTCLGHLPLTCQFSVVEIELLPPYVSDEIIKLFKGDILHRKKERQRRAKEEREREKHINAINDRQMGKLISSTANINITSSQEFPTCGFEEPLPTVDQSDNIPSTSKGSRQKTFSTSSAGSCSYSSIAISCKEEYSPWKTQPHLPRPKVDTCEIGQTDGPSILNSIQTNLGDVLAQALSQKKNASSAGSKKSKKSKKMLPLYSTGMNFTK